MGTPNVATLGTTTACTPYHPSPSYPAAPLVSPFSVSVVGRRGKLCLVLDLDHTLLNSATFAEVGPTLHDSLKARAASEAATLPEDQRLLFRIDGIKVSRPVGVRACFSSLPFFLSTCTALGSEADGRVGCGTCPGGIPLPHLPSCRRNHQMVHTRHHSPAMVLPADVDQAAPGGAQIPAARGALLPAVDPHQWCGSPMLPVAGSTAPCHRPPMPLPQCPAPPYHLPRLALTSALPPTRRQPRVCRLCCATAGPRRRYLRRPHHRARRRAC